MSEVKKQIKNVEFWKGEYRKAKAGEKTIADEMSPEELREFKHKPKPNDLSALKVSLSTNSSSGPTCGGRRVDMFASELTEKEEK